MNDEARAVEQETRRTATPRSLDVAPHAWFRGLSLAAVSGPGVWTYCRYRAAREMDIAVREFSDRDYPENPALRSVQYGKYSGRRLTLVQRDDSHFDFIFAPAQSHVAEVAFRDVDVSLMTPSLPEWTRADAGLRRIALTDRQWNRQQVQFNRNSPQLEVSRGDGFEQANLFTAELAKNCLNAGLWELLLFIEEAGRKALYYHGWFTFPLGQYKRIFQRSTGLSYWRHFYYLEHWVDPEGVRIPLDRLRRVTREREVPARFEGDERVMAAGEQALKKRTMLADDVIVWKDFYDGRPIRFATFARPGRYYLGRPWNNEFWRMERFERCILRDILTPATSRPLQELELVFTSGRGGSCRFIVSGFNLEVLPQAPIGDYTDGLSMAMGIGIPPVFETYEDLQRKPPQKSPFFSLMLDARDRWLNHHRIAVDGSVLHRDAVNPDVLHVYLMSYERHTMLAHLVIESVN